MSDPAFPHMITRIKMRQLVLLTHLAKKKSIMHASDAAGMTQPAASKLLRELEETLGVPLFVRHGRGVEPTPYGELVLRHAQSVLSEIHRTQEEVAAMKRGEQFRIAIGTVLSPGVDLLPLAISKLTKQYPKLIITLESASSRSLVNDLLEGRLDVVIGRIPNSDDASNLVFEELADEPHQAIVGSGHTLLGREQLSMGDLVDQTWIFPRQGSMLRERLHNLFLQRGLCLPSKIIEADSIPIITSLLYQNDMVVALPKAVVRPYCDAGVLSILPVDIQTKMDSFGLITRQGQTLLGPIAEALRILRDTARQIYNYSESRSG